MHRLVVKIDNGEELAHRVLTREVLTAVTPLAFDVCDGEGNVVWRAMEFRGAIAELTDWVTKNAASLLHEEPPVVLAPGGSLAARIATFYESVDTNNDAAVDAVFFYRERHGLQFAFLGTDLPDIYIGLNGGAHEISCITGAPWSYEIDMARFLTEATFGHAT
jgi:hypothetical protein